jgi:hypothetical protein
MVLPVHELPPLALKPGTPGSLSIRSSGHHSVNDEKLGETNYIESEATSSCDEEAAVEYTEAEERRVVRKLDIIVMPLLFLGFYVFQVNFFILRPCLGSP